MPRRSAPKPVELDRSRAPIVAAVLIFVGLAATAGAIAWGTSDSGQINVSATIANSQHTSSENGEVSTTPTPTEEHRTMPNGGLVAQGGEVPAPPEPTVVPEEATTTDDTAIDSPTNDAAGEATPETQADQSETIDSPDPGSAE